MPPAKLIDGFVTLAGDFPPTLNKEQDATLLKPNESPDCYGVDCDKDGRLKTGSCPTGTTITPPAGTGSYTSWAWYYNRLWKASTTTLTYGAPEYRNFVYRQGLGSLTADASIVTFLPSGERDLCLFTASGAQIVSNADSHDNRFVLGRLMHELKATGATKVLVLDGNPVVSNTSGVFLYDGQKTVELTRAVRDSLGSFSDVAITADYTKKRIIGTSKYVIDLASGKLFDYGTAGFRFTTRTLSHSGEYNPFQVISVVFLIEHGSTAGGTISWQSKSDDDEWWTETGADAPYSDNTMTRVRVPIDNAVRNCRRFAVRLTGLTSNIYIREIQVEVRGLAHESFAR